MPCTAYQNSQIVPDFLGYFNRYVIVRASQSLYICTFAVASETFYFYEEQNVFTLVKTDKVNTFCFGHLSTDLFP